MRTGPRKSATGGYALAASLLAHATVLSLVGFVAYRSLALREARRGQSLTDPGAAVIAVELPAFSDGTLASEREPVPEGEVPTAHGGATIPRLDSQNAGHGGARSSQPAQNLADTDDRIRLEMDLVSRLDREQVQRLRTARDRTAWEDRRATTHPMELTFLATGDGRRDERRPNAPSDPNRGSLVARAASVVGGSPGTGREADPEGEGASRGAMRSGGLVASPGLGVRSAEAGVDHRAAAHISHARPSVTEGPVTIPANERARPNDTVDSDQEVASAVRSLVHASVAGGAPGVGLGGSEGSADPGAGAPSGRGSVAHPLGSGDGEVFDWRTNDPMLLPYFRKLHEKVDPLWRNAFPRSALLELKQGTVILELTIEADGTAHVHWPPLRPSGIDEFDRNCADAIRRASPFDPIPRVLRDQGRHRLRIRAPFDAKNPIVK